MALSSSGITSDNAALLRQHTMDYLHRNTFWKWRHHQRNKMLSQLLKCTHCQNCTKLLKLLSTHFICTYLRKSPSSPTTRQILEKISPELIQQLNDVKPRVTASPRNLAVDSIVHVHHASLQQQRQSYWHLIIITTVCTITIIGILCFSLRSRIYRQILPCFSTHKPPNSHTELQVIPSTSSIPNPGTNEARH